MFFSRQKSDPGKAHRKWTDVRARAYTQLFGCLPEQQFTAAQLGSKKGDDIFIDVVVFPIVAKGFPPAYAAVTNGMSDRAMNDGPNPESPRRRELIQYLPKCTPGHARRLRDMAWLPHFDGFMLDTHHTIAWKFPAVEGTPWTSAFFLESIIPLHQQFSCKIDGDDMSFLWHVPISEAEREFKNEHGPNALLDRMDEVEMPWIFDEENRPSLI